LLHPQRTDMNEHTRMNPSTARATGAGKPPLPPTPLHDNVVAGESSPSPWQDVANLFSPNSAPASLPLGAASAHGAQSTKSAQSVQVVTRDPGKGAYGQLSDDALESCNNKGRAIAPRYLQSEFRALPQPPAEDVADALAHVQRLVVAIIPHRPWMSWLLGKTEPVVMMDRLSGGIIVAAADDDFDVLSRHFVNSPPLVARTHGLRVTVIYMESLMVPQGSSYRNLHR